MLPNIYRIKVNGFYQRNGPFKKVSSAHLAITTKPSSNPNARFVIIVPKSVDKKSSYRNQIRRQIEEEIRRDYMQSLGNVDISIRVYKKLESISFEWVKNELHQLLGESIAIKK